MLMGARKPRTWEVEAGKFKVESQPWETSEFKTNLSSEDSVLNHPAPPFDAGH